jgi:ankyrin repeat protein
MLPSPELVVNPETELRDACRQGDIKYVVELLAIGTKAGVNALAVACASGFTYIVELLIANKAPVNQLASDGWSPLTRACSEGCYEIAELLLLARADVEMPSTSDETPLLQACFDGHPDIISLLYKHGADPLRKYAEHGAPLDAARGSGDVAIMEVLLAAI